MSKRDWARFGFATLLVAFSVFALISIWSFSPSDPCWGLEDYSAKAEGIQNTLGLPGACLAGPLRIAFGRTSYLLVFLLATWGIEIFARGRIKHPPLRIIGGILLLASGVTIAAMLSAEMPGRPDRFGDSPCGYLGKLLWNYLHALLPPTRAKLVLLVATAVALIMLTDLRIIAWLGRFTAFLLKLVSFIVSRPKRATGELPPPESLAVPNPLPSPPVVQTRESLRRAGRIGEGAAGTGGAGDGAMGRRGESAPKIVGLPTGQVGATSKEPTKQPSLWHDDYKFPPVNLLDRTKPLDLSQQEGTIRQNAVILETTLKEFGIEAQVVEIQRGPVITQYELSLAPGIRVGRIMGLSDDIAVAVKAPSVRVVAPIPGKSTVGVEVPNALRDTVRMRELLDIYQSSRRRVTLPLMLGKDAAGNPLISDLSVMPHLLIAGATGSGKSVCINAAILSVLMTRHPDDVKLLLVDPKMVELACFKDIPHLMCPVVSDMKKAAAILEWACRKMDDRYELLARTKVRNISMYNELGAEEIRRRLTAEEEDVSLDDVPFRMPYVIIVVDELADLMMTAAKEVETSVTRLSQKSRAVGIHILLATQRPSVDVVTGLIKANLPSRIAFHMSSKVDSRTILDQNGAEKLLGMGDMLFLPPGSSKLIRAQGTLVTEEEIKRVVDFLKEQSAPQFSDELVKHSAPSSRASADEHDELYNEAVRIVLENERGSVSLLQRKLEIGYCRAARLIDLMAEDGIVGEYKGSQARECLIKLDQWEAMQAERGKAD
jgi:S-DNA-T family DNA segregation ATPase FtsK/SpoIIIE